MKKKVNSSIEAKKEDRRIKLTSISNIKDFSVCQNEDTRVEE